MTLGEKIQDIRKTNGMSQEYLAELLSVSRQAISKWETGLSKPSTENLIHLSKIFNVPVEQLTHPNTRVELVMDVRKEVLAMKKNSKKTIVVVGLFLVLFLGTFAMALYGRFSGSYDDTTILYLMITSACCMLFSFLPIIVTILRYVYRDCESRNIKPTFWVIISTTFIGLAYYLMKRDTLSHTLKRD